MAMQPDKIPSLSEADVSERKSGRSSSSLSSHGYFEL